MEHFFLNSVAFHSVDYLISSVDTGISKKTTGYLYQFFFVNVNELNVDMAIFNLFLLLLLTILIGL